MELSHRTSDLDPSSVLGFGSALSMLDSTEEVARLLTGALRESRERLTRIIDSAIDAIISIDTELEIHLFNAAAEDISWCPTEADGRYLLILRDVDGLKQAEAEVAQLESERSYLQEELKHEYNLDEIVGVSAPMQAVFDAIDQMADTETTVLVTGETGTGKEIEGLSASAMTALKGYDWLGNVRELANIIERAVILTRDRRTRAEHLSISDSSGPDGTGSFETLEEVQRRHIERALEQTGGVVGGDEGAAQLLGVKRTTLHSRMDRLGIEPSEYRV